MLSWQGLVIVFMFGIMMTHLYYVLSSLLDRDDD